MADPYRGHVRRRHDTGGGATELSADLLAPVRLLLLAHPVLVLGIVVACAAIWASSTRKWVTAGMVMTIFPLERGTR